MSGFVAAVRSGQLFEADIRRTDLGPTGTNDVGIERVGAGTGSMLALGLPQSADGQYHNLRMEMDHAANEVRHYVDDVLVATVPPYSDLSAVIPSSNAIDILFGNPGISAKVEIDNVSFRLPTPVPALGPLGIVACGFLLLVVGAGLFAMRAT